MFRSRVALLLSLACVLLLPSLAFGQTAPPAIPAGAVSGVTIVIALLGILAGYVVQALNSGSFLGFITIPKPVLPYLGLAGGFLGAFTSSIAAAPLKDEAAWLTALYAGLVGLGGVVAGVTAKQHVDAHLRAPTPPRRGVGKDAVHKAADAFADDTVPPPTAQRSAYRTSARPIRVRPGGGWARLGVIAALFAPVLLGVWLAISIEGCANGVPTPQTQAVINASVSLTLCVEGVIKKDETASPPVPAPQVILDEGITCSSEAIILANAIGQAMSPAPTPASLIANAHAGVVARRAARGTR